MKRLLRLLIVLCFLGLAFMGAFFIVGFLLSALSPTAPTPVPVPSAPNKQNKYPAPVTTEDASPYLHEISLLMDLPAAVAEKKRAISHYTTIDKIAPDVLHAVVAVEDSRFYSHWGFDPKGMARALLVNLKAGHVEEGASTITQQLAKNMFLNDRQSFSRKAEELLFALDLEAHFSKDEILELYLNTIYFGAGFTGIGEAAPGYFDLPPAKLDLAESAMLAGLPNAPSLYSPYEDFMLGKKRQLIVLDAMEKNGYITAAAAASARIEPLTFARNFAP